MKTDDDDVIALKFGIPFEMVVEAVMGQDNPTINGRRLSLDEQKMLAICLWQYYYQNYPEDLRDIALPLVEERWPSLDWDEASKVADRYMAMHDLI